MSINGQTLIAWGFEPGAWFKEALPLANRMAAGGADDAAIRAALRPLAPPVYERLSLRPAGAVPVTMNIRAEGPEEAANIESVAAHMRELVRLPTVVAAAVMPDACPAGAAKGTIPVGGVVAARDAIHPGMHSADICCSMAITVIGDVDPKAVLDLGMTLSHFGPGGRRGTDIVAPSPDMLARFEKNPFLRDLGAAATEHFATQGDGNHFFYVGRRRSTGEIALVTHHGSRRPGAELYKRGLAVAERLRAKIAPEVAPHNAWIPASSGEGEAYWEALQLVRTWTRESHYAIHDRVLRALGASPRDRFWNEHNFVFRRDDGLFYHAKGATPAFAGFGEDSGELTLVPLNMAEPILLLKGADAPHGLGFAPHGAGRNFGRRAYLKRHAGRSEADWVAHETRGIDARFFCGLPDVSELPGAYKDAAAVRAQIAEFGLGAVVDTIEPYGSIMAGDWERPFRERRAEKRRTARNG